MASSRQRVAAATFVLTVVATGCDALLGLGHFKDVPCALDCPDVTTVDASLAETGARETGLPGGGPMPADASDAADAVVDVQAMDATDAIPPVEAASPHEVWAHWPMPNPDAAIAPDSSTLLPNPMTYDASVDGSVVDIVTGLTWEGRRADGLGLRERLVPVPGARHAGPDPHRARVAGGLHGIAGHQQRCVSRDPDGRSSGPRRSSGRTLRRTPRSQYWSVSFATGLVDNGTPPAYVRCVAGGSR